MPKPKRVRQTAVNTVPLVGHATHEPAVPLNWPDGHVSIRETGMSEEECFVITIHGIDHYLHATTAYELYKKMGEVITAWDKQAKKHGVPGVID